ncbi:RNA demethylase ALKBH10B [Mercurialis annua]|uniref:RNA demethylase ALKBH10B n=1 Tax=Mercurialis annua TaxID=3986 RepID=UPI00215ED7B8|nr:RNA demethylase ALKBH10B [Mercurialis annua]
MAMPPGNVVVSDKIQYPGGGGGVGNEIHQQQQHHQRHGWFPVDERDGFISWLRGEFAAANAIIDSLCHHLRAVGEPGEYDLVIGCIQQRRCNWNPVLHMQQYFSVGEVIVALQQVALRKQQQQQQLHQNQYQHQHQQQQHRYYYDQPKMGGKDFKRSFNAGFNKGQRGGGEMVREVVSYNAESHNLDSNSSGNVVSEKLEEIKSGSDSGKSEDKSLAIADDKKDVASKPHVDKISGNSEGTLSGTCEVEADPVDEQSSSQEIDLHTRENQNVKQNLTTPTPRTFVGAEIVDGKTVNVVDGLKLYDQLLDDVEVSKLVSLVNDLRVAGRKGQFQGQTYVVSKRPMKGHGREMIQFGLPIADSPAEEENATGTSKDRKIEPIPTLLQEVIERLVGMQIMTVKPDSCIIDIYNEGDHSQPHMWPPWFGRPISVLSLTECNLTFGRVITAEHPGDYGGSLKLPLAPGSLLVLQGKSTDFAKHAIPAIRKQRILVTFTKSQPRRFAQTDGQRLASAAASPSSHWIPPPSSRSPNHILRHPAPKHYAPIPTSGVLPAPSIRSQVPQPNGVQPIFVTAPVAAPMPFPASVAIPPASTGWPAPPPRHPSNRLPAPVPGTGVFLPPPGSGNTSSPQIPTGGEINFHVDTSASFQGKENGPGKSNNGTCASPKENMDGKIERQDCNGIANGKAATKDEQQQSVDPTAVSK